MPDHPPRVAEWLLRWLLTGRDGDVIAGDLRETYAVRGGGRLWYWIQVTTCVRIWFSPYRRAIPDLRQDLHYAARHPPKSWIRDSRYLVPGAGYWGELDRLQPPGWDVFSHAAGAARGSHSSDRPRRFDARILARLLGPPRRPPCIYRRNHGGGA